MHIDCIIYMCIQRKVLLSPSDFEIFLLHLAFPLQFHDTIRIHVYLPYVLVYDVSYKSYEREEYRSYMKTF